MRSRRSAPSVVYDPDAHREFVTGFRKRKLQRKQIGEKKAAEAERKARIEERRQKREVIRANRKQVIFGETGEVSSGEEEEKLEESQVLTYNGDDAVVTATVTPMKVGSSSFQNMPRKQPANESKQEANTTTTEEPIKLGVNKQLKKSKSAGSKRVSFTHAFTKANKKRLKLKRARKAKKQ